MDHSVRDIAFKDAPQRDDAYAEQVQQGEQRARDALRAALSAADHGVLVGAMMAAGAVGPYADGMADVLARAALAGAGAVL